LGKFSLLSLRIAALLALTFCCGPGCDKEGRAPVAEGSGGEVPPGSGGGVPVVATPGGNLVLVPAGDFLMGSDTGGADEKPAHKVWVEAFLVDQTETTQENYGRLTRKSPSHFKGTLNPVEQVSWVDAVLYCNARSRAEGLEPCYDEKTGRCDFDRSGYRLPTEAEWEYACRASSSAANTGPLGSYAWFTKNAAGKTHPVGTKRPNGWGLFDMQGNVMEWCNDVYAADYYPTSPERNPRGPGERATSKFVLRGGAWNVSAEACGPSYRVGASPGQLDGCFGRDDIGFRCVRRAPQK
jgi:formylglycine-generating enzyme required for sulfatase activity